MRLFKNGSFVVAILVLSVITGFAQVPADYSAAGVKVLVADTWLFNAGVDNAGNWEPYTSIFGDGTIAVCANTFADGTTSDSMNLKVAFVNPITGEIKDYWAFYTDAKTPYTGNLNEVRKDGNPGRVAADRRAGGVRYAVAMESTPYNYAEFNTDKRWNKKFNYDDRLMAIQIFEKTANGPKPISNVIDPVYGGGDIAGDQGAQQIRVGDVTFLSNGNVLTIVEDRAMGIFPDGKAAMATIFNGETGAVIKKPWNVAGDEATHESWSNAVAFKGGFAVKTNAIVNVYDNDGNLKYYMNQADWTTVKDMGRGDGSRLASNINSNYVYFAGLSETADVVLTRFDAVGTTASGLITDIAVLKGLKEIIVNEDQSTLAEPMKFDRTNTAVDENDNVCVTYSAKNTEASALDNVVARVFKSDMTPGTPSFYAFKYHDTIDATEEKYRSHEPAVSMDNNSIVIAADGITWDEKNKAVSGIEQTLFVVLANPLKKITKIEDWQLW